MHGECIQVDLVREMPALLVMLAIPISFSLVILGLAGIVLGLYCHGSETGAFCMGAAICGILFGLSHFCVAALALRRQYRK